MVSGKDYIGTSIVSGSVHGCVCARLVRLFMTPFTIARQAPLSMEFPRQQDWSGLPLPSPGDLPSPGMERTPPALASGLFPAVALGSPVPGRRGSRLDWALGVVLSVEKRGKGIQAEQTVWSWRCDRAQGISRNCRYFHVAGA